MASNHLKPEPNQGTWTAPTKTNLMDVQLLPDDVLLVIFSFLNLYDIGQVARVCKRWNAVTKCSPLWKSIDLNQCHKTTYYIPGREKLRTHFWWFPEDLANVRLLLKTYLCKSTKRVTLRFAEIDILMFIRDNVTHLEELMFVLRDSNFDLCVLSNNLINLKIDFYRKRGCIENCTGLNFLQLRTLSISNIQFDAVVINWISRCRSLSTLHVDKCVLENTDGILQIAQGASKIKELCLKCLYYSLEQFEETVQYILKSFNLIKLLVEIPSVSNTMHVSSDHLEADMNLIMNAFSYCPTIKSLDFINLGNLQKASFQVMLISLQHLEHLGLSCGWDADGIDDELLSLIEPFSPRLKSLDVSHCKQITDEGLRSLCHHEALEVLDLSDCEQLSSKAIIETLSTLPKIRSVNIGHVDDYHGCAQKLLQYNKSLKVQVQDGEILYQPEVL